MGQGKGVSQENESQGVDIEYVRSPCQPPPPFKSPSNRGSWEAHGLGEAKVDALGWGTLGSRLPKLDL